VDRRVIRVYKEVPETPGLKDLRATRGIKVTKVIRVSKGFRGTKETPDPKVLRGIKVIQDHRVLKETRVPKERKAFRVLRGIKEMMEPPSPSSAHMPLTQLSSQITRPDLSVTGILSMAISMYGTAPVGTM